MMDFTLVVKFRNDIEESELYIVTHRGACLFRTIKVDNSPNTLKFNEITVGHAINMLYRDYPSKIEYVKVIPA